MPRIKSSRRAAGLKPTDFDHTIDLVDHDATATNTAGDSTSALGRTSTDARLLPSSSVASQTLSQVQSPASSTSADAGDGSLQPQQSLPISLDGQQDVPHPAMRPSIETRGRMPP